MHHEQFDQIAAGVVHNLGYADGIGFDPNSLWKPSKPAPVKVTQYDAWGNVTAQYEGDADVLRTHGMFVVDELEDDL